MSCNAGARKVNVSAASALLLQQLWMSCNAGACKVNVSAASALLLLPAAAVPFRVLTRPKGACVG